MQVGTPTPSSTGSPAAGAATRKLHPPAGVSTWRSDVPTRATYMRSVGEIERSMHDLAAAHPDRARVIDIGDSARKVRGEDGGHDLFALVLGEQAGEPSVPRVLVTAGVHPRETANPNVLVEWARRTLEGAAAGDAARGALLRERTTILVPVVNPDSLETVIAGLDAGNPDQIWRRTNDGAQGGVDLNRNFDNHWGAGSGDPADQNFRGPHAASEPEVQALQRLGQVLHPSAVYDIHSPGNVVLVPSGAPDARAAAELVARATGYEVSSSDQHWSKPVGGGTVKDWAHDQLGAVSLTIETGDVHHQDDAQYADTLRRMLPALDALVATVDGRADAPAGAEGLAAPSQAAPLAHPPSTRSAV